MIYYSKELLPKWEPELIMLDMDGDVPGHLYVTRNTYDQAVILYNMYDGEFSKIESALGVAPSQRMVVSYAFEILPEPIKILAPFYNLVSSNVEIDTSDVEVLVGVLSWLSMNLDFKNVLKVPPEVRSSLVFNKSILLDYQSYVRDFHFHIYGNGEYIQVSKDSSISDDNTSGGDEAVSDSSSEDEEPQELPPWEDPNSPFYISDEEFEQVKKNTREQEVGKIELTGTATDVYVADAVAARDAVNNDVDSYGKILGRWGGC